MDTQFLIDLLTMPYRDPFADEPKPCPDEDDFMAGAPDTCSCGEPITSLGFEMCDECNDRITSKYGFDPMPR